MADPFTAIGLAGNIAQFIDFSCKLFSAARKINNSTSGLQSDEESLNDLYFKLQRFCYRIGVQIPPTGFALAESFLDPPTWQELKDLAQNCEVSA
jgi:hypothetical protein